MTLADLKARLPSMVAQLEDQMLTSTIPCLEATELELGEAWPSVVMVFEPRDGSTPFQVRLSIQEVGAGAGDLPADEVEG